MKIAYFSPLNPQPSGISDYSEELLPYLATQADIDLFVDGFQPSNQELSTFKCFDYRRDPSKLDSLHTYDAAIYHLGNDHRYHAGISKVLKYHPGIAVFHEYVFQDFFIGQARDLNNWQLYLDELEACYGPMEKATAEEAIKRGNLPPQASAPLDYPLNCTLARAAEGIIAHSEWSRLRLSQIAPNVSTRHISMPIKLVRPALRRAWSQRDSLRPFVSISSFGQIIPRKGIEQTLEALGGLRDLFDFHFTLVGAENQYWDVRELIIRYGLTEHVTITGYVSLEEFEQNIAATDIAINLREYTVGETSASLCRIMGLGIPAVVSDIGWFAEIPDDCVVKIAPDENFVANLRSALRKLLASESLRTQIGNKARDFITTEHNVWRTATKYISFVREVIDHRTARTPQRSFPRSELESNGTNHAERKPERDAIAVSPTPQLTTDDPTNSKRKLRLAYFSPFNPQPSGISDYSEELLMHLRDYAEVDLFVDGFTPSNPSVTANFRFFDYRKKKSAPERLDEYDAVIYHMGNDYRYHSGIYQVMKRHPGIVVFHDFALQDFFLGLARSQGTMNIYLDELEACNGNAERAKAAEYIQRGALPPQISAPLDFPLNGRMARSSEGIIVHSEWSRHRLEVIAPGVPIAHIQHHITAHAANTPSVKLKANEKHKTAIASFGLITPDKAIERALRALSALRDSCDFHYTLVGSAENFTELPHLIRKYGLENHVSITNYVSLEEFQQRILETDIAINLRERPVGATSGSLCRIMAAGIPAIISNVGAFSELPDGAVVKLDHDEFGDALLQAYLRKLIEDPVLRMRIGQNARRYVLADHKIELSAEKYVAFIREVIARRPRKKLIDRAKAEMAALCVNEHDEALLRGVAVELAALAPVDAFVPGKRSSFPSDEPAQAAAEKTFPGANGSNSRSITDPSSAGRMPKVEGIDYKRGALEYTKLLSSELSYYLRTKPFCNLHKPIKYSGDGMDPETHRHFTDFANIAASLALRPNSRILDVGCGPGWLSEYFARLGYDVTGIDISEDLIAVARERLERLSYQVDHDTPVKCRFIVHDIERELLDEKFDAIICYDALHHFEDEQSVFSNLAALLNLGGFLFILEGQKPAPGSATEEELRSFMRKYKTLESPFSKEYLYQLLNDNGFALVGNYVSVNGLFEREMLEGSDSDLKLPLRTIDTDYHYLTAMKVISNQPAARVPDSRNPGRVRAEITTQAPLPTLLQSNESFELQLTITNEGDTLWLTGQTTREGVVMPGVRVFDEQGNLVSEVHGPLLPRAVAPGQTILVKVGFAAPSAVGTYAAKIDLVDEHICWFEDRGSAPLTFSFEIENKR